MTQQPATSQHATVTEAAAILGVSTTTIRRMIRRGQLEGQRVERPQGTAFVVTLPVDAAPPLDDAADTRQASGGMARSNATPSEQMATFAAAILTPVLAPLVAQIEAHRQTVERQADALRELERENGRLAMENATLRASQAKHTG
jgi:excisionase family DNA binding protein